MAYKIWNLIVWKPIPYNFIPDLIIGIILTIIFSLVMIYLFKEGAKK